MYYRKIKKRKTNNLLLPGNPSPLRVAGERWATIQILPICINTRHSTAPRATLRRKRRPLSPQHPPISAPTPRSAMAPHQVQPAPPHQPLTNINPSSVTNSASSAPQCRNPLCYCCWRIPKSPSAVSVSSSVSLTVALLVTFLEPRFTFSSPPAPLIGYFLPGQPLVVNNSLATKNEPPHLNRRRLLHIRHQIPRSEQIFDGGDGARVPAANALAS